MKIIITESQLKALEKLLISETSSDKVMGAAKKMWHNKISGDGYMKNPRAEKLLTDFGNKLKGLEIAGGEIKSVKPFLETNGPASYYLFFFINFSGTMTFNNDSYSGIWYNYSTDKYMVGAQLSDNLRGIDEFKDTSLTKFDARQLYKIANHLNPKTRYVNFTREIPYNHE